MSDNEPLPDDAMQLALTLTGVKTRKVPVSDIGEGEEFVYEGHLCTVVENTERYVKASTTQYDDGRCLMFWDFSQLDNPGPLVLSWATEVITDARPTKPDPQEIAAKDLQADMTFIYKGQLYLVDMKDEYGVTGNCPGQPGVTFYNPDCLDPINDADHDTNRPLWTETVLVDESSTKKDA